VGDGDGIMSARAQGLGLALEPGPDGIMSARAQGLGLGPELVQVLGPDPEVAWGVGLGYLQADLLICSRSDEDHWQCPLRLG